MKKVLLFIVVLACCFCLSRVAKADLDRAGLSEIMVTGYKVSTDNLIIEGTTNHVDAPNTPAYAAGVRVFVNGFPTMTTPDGNWVICVPRVMVGSLMDPATKVQLIGIDLSTGVTVEKSVSLVGVERAANRLEKFSRFHEEG